MTKYGHLGGYWVVPGIAPSQYTLPVHHPGYTPAPHSGHGGTGVWCTVQSRGVKVVVGLISVDQLSLSLHFSRLRTMTEVYNALRIDNR